MSRLILHVLNLRALRTIEWPLDEGVHVLLGTNGVGKTTLLFALKLMRAAFARGLPEAVATVLGGGRDLKSWGAYEDETVRLGLTADDLRWEIQLIPRGATVDHLAEETLHQNGALVFRKDSLGKFELGALRLEADERVGLRALMDMRSVLLADHGTAMAAVSRMASLINGLLVFHDLDLKRLRDGSDGHQRRHLHSRSTNALTLLRGWQQRPPEAHRFRFVLDGLRAAFPDLVSNIGFDEGGATLTADIYRPGSEVAAPLGTHSNGVIALLALLCNLAAAEPGGLVAIDEPENGLHPFAIRAFLRAADAWAHSHHLSVVLASHSPALVDCFGDRPDRVFLLRTQDLPAPIALDRLKNRTWLDRFRLGELLVDGEFGSNGD